GQWFWVQAVKNNASPRGRAGYGTHDSGRGAGGGPPQTRRHLLFHGAGDRTPAGLGSSVAPVAQNKINLGRIQRPEYFASSASRAASTNLAFPEVGAGGQPAAARSGWNTRTLANPNGQSPRQWLQAKCLLGTNRYSSSARDAWTHAPAVAHTLMHFAI